jgi:hypothetical protein
MVAFAQSAYVKRMEESEKSMPTTTSPDELDDPKYGIPDDENPEWTKERIANAMTYPNFPPEVMRIIEADKKKRAAQEAA